MIKVIQVFALLISIMGYLGSNPEKYPFAFHVLSPAFSNAKKGLEELQSDRKILTKENTGFKEITDILRQKIRPVEEAKKAKFVKLEKGSSGIGFGNDGARMFDEINVHIENQTLLKYELDKIEQELKGLIDKKYFSISNFMFWLGASLTSILIFIDKSKRSGLNN